MRYYNMSSSTFYSEYGGYFWLGVGGVLTGICIAAFKNCYKCKCTSEIGLCCGLVTINRDTEHETTIDNNQSRAELGTAGSDDIPPSSPSQHGKSIRFAGYPFPSSESGKYSRKNSSPPQPI